MFLVLGIHDIGSTPEGRIALGKFEAVGKSICSPPVNLPGCNYYNGLKVQKD
jgi:hypothetical protein